MTKMKLIAITGGIGSGKSAVLECVKELGYPAYSCDQIVLELYKERKFLKGLKKLFPTVVKGFVNFSVDRGMIASEVFANKEKLAKLNAYTHPKVYQRIFEKAKIHLKPVFVEVPLLFESGFESKFDGVIIVIRPLEERIKSVVERSKLTKDQVMERVNNQVDYSTFDLSPYVVIENDGDIESLKEQTKFAITLVQNALKN